MANQFWTELSDKQAQAVAGGTLDVGAINVAASKEVFLPASPGILKVAKPNDYDGPFPIIAV